MDCKFSDAQYTAAGAALVPSAEKLVRNARKVTINDKEISVVSPQKLLELKKNIKEPREKDLFDIQELKKIIEKENK